MKIMKFTLVLAFSFLLSYNYSFGYEREQLTFSTQETKNVWRQRKTVISIVSDQKGPIASIISNPQRSSTDYHFKIPIAQAAESTVRNHSISILSNIRDFREVFDEIGFPQLGMLTALNGSTYGLIMVTKKDIEPKELYIIDTDNPTEAEAFYNKMRHRSGVSGTFGEGFSGVHSATIQFDAAVLIEVKAGQPEIIKVYDFLTNFESLGGYDTPLRLQEALSEYAYSDLRNHVECQRALSASNSSK